MYICCVSLVLACLVPATHAVAHMTTLIWSEKSGGYNSDGSVRLVGVPGDPATWIRTRRFPLSVGQSTPFDPDVREQSARIALGFQYSTQRVYWSDRGFRQIMRTTLQEVDRTPYLYNATVNRVYHGISREVNGLAVDWLSGALYWTDALYNWITVAAAEKNDIYRHLVTTDLEKPMGICVWPQKGYMYWADMGGVPRIERARLDGSERTALVTSDLDHPKGMTLDIENGYLYWVDDFQDTVNRLQLSTMDRIQYAVPTVHSNQHNSLFGITVFRDFVFVTDQTYHQMKIYNRTNGSWVFNADLLDLPYDIMMYDESLQEIIPTDCPMLGCKDICVSTGDGGGKCMCRQGYDLDLDGKACKRNNLLTQPAFLYTIGRSLCSTRIQIADRDHSHPFNDVECFYDDVTHARALALHARAELIFYSDLVHRTIHRLSVTNNFKKETIAAQTGQVKGICVDWLTDNLYWSDETRGHIYVSRIDGRYPLLLLQNLGMPRGVALHPVKGKMYWGDASSNTIFRANMDGTDIEVFQNDISPPNGLTFDLVENRLYWVDETGISSVSEDGLDKKILIHDPLGGFRDVTLFQDYFAYTDGQSSVFYGPKATGEQPREVQHIDSLVSHDILSYDTYLQPINNPGKCNSAMCEQLCLPNDSGYTCKCAYGFRLGEDGFSCNSDLVDMNFLLFVDPYQRQIYQLNLESSNANPQGIHLPTPEFPSVIDVDAVRSEILWLDESSRVIKKAPLQGGLEEIVVVVPEDHNITSFAMSSLSREVLFSDSYRKAIYRSGLKHGDAEYLFASNAIATKMLVYEEKSTLYWVQQNTGGLSYGIYRQHVDDTNDAVQVVESQQEITGLGIDREAQELYWCTSKQIMKSSLDGKTVAMVHIDNDDAMYSGLAVTPKYTYFVHQNKMSVYRRTHANGQVNAVTEDFFSRIIDIKDFSWIKPGSQFVAAGITQEPADITLVIGIVAAAGVLLLMVLIIAIVVYKVHQKRKLAPGDFETQAHENPTYATTVVPEPDPIYYTLGGARRPASAGSRDSDLPDVVKLPLPEDEPSPSPSPADTEHVVKPSEVLLTVNGGVQFKPRF